jgi:hypothetical protein
VRNISTNNSGERSTIIADPIYCLAFAPRPVRGLRMLLGIIGEVAPLAPMPEIIIVAILRHMIQVRDGQHNVRAGDGV